MGVGQGGVCIFLGPKNPSIENDGSIEQTLNDYLSSTLAPAASNFYFGSFSVFFFSCFEKSSGGLFN